MGMYSTDEPRYADIGRAMARTGDWITPRLWGQPWFEKPPLLYWMTAAGFQFGLSEDLAPRLPMALLSVGFLVFFWLRVRQLFDEKVAAYSTAILATSAGWLAYSHVAVADLPVTAFFSAAVLLSIRPKEPAAEPRRVAAAIALGLAVLAKSLPPLILFLPVLFVDRANWRRWFASWPIVAFFAVALPWHLLAAVRNGSHFARVLFIEQQFGRFLNSSRQHGQPWWFYIPIFLALLFPWFPLLPLAFRAGKQDTRAPLLFSIVAVGFVFFSASVNKLPGYVLPLVPVACVLLGIGLNSARPERWLVAPIALLGVFPFAISAMPGIASQGLKSTPIQWTQAALAVVAAGALGLAAVYYLRSRALPLAVALAVAGFLWAEAELLPALDTAASARPMWLSTHPECAPVLARARLYGLYYYSGKQLPGCAIVDKNAFPAEGTAH